MSDYESHIDDRHRQAFNALGLKIPEAGYVILSRSLILTQVIDKNKDGHLILDEVVQCLTPGTYRYREFHKALQLYTPEGFKDARRALWAAL